MKLLSKTVVSSNVGQLRILDYLIQHVDSIPSRNAAKKALKAGFIFLDGVKAQGGWFVGEGQVVEHFHNEANVGKRFEKELEIIYEDDYLALINKPAGLSVSGNYFRTVQNALAFNLKDSCLPDAIVPRPVHRLDNQTSGILLVAKTHSALINLGKQFESKIIKKQYKAIVVGELLSKKGKIDDPIEGKAATTIFELEKKVDSPVFKKLSLLNIKILTGRTHQIRIHLSSNGYPILGDKLYTKPDLLFKGKGLFLCAYNIEFCHPKNNVRRSFSIELPAKFRALMLREQNRWNRLNN